MATARLATVYFGISWIDNSEKHAVIARSIARMSFHIHGVPDFHFYSIADGTSDVLKGRGGNGGDLTRPKPNPLAEPFRFVLDVVGKGLDPAFSEARVQDGK